MEKKYTDILLDLDGTLFDFDLAEAKSFQRMCEHFHLPYSDALLEEYHQINISYWKRFEAGEFPKKEFLPMRFTDLFHHHQLEVDGMEANLYYKKGLALGNDLLPHALELCEVLSKNYCLHLCTNGDTYVQETRLKDSPIMPYVSNVFISDSIGHQKPKKEFFDAVFTALPKDAVCLMVGDSLTSDIQGGINAGLDTCWYQPSKEMVTTKGIHPTYVIHELLELPKLLS